MAIVVDISGDKSYVVIAKYASNADNGTLNGPYSDFSFVDLDGTNIEATSATKGTLTFAYDEFQLDNVEPGVVVSNAAEGINLILLYLNGGLHSELQVYNKIVDLTEVKAWNPSMALTSPGDRYVLTSIKMVAVRNTTRFDAGNVGIYNGVSLVMDLTTCIDGTVDYLMWMGSEIGDDADLTIQSDNLATVGDDYVSLIITYNLLS